MLNEKVSYTPGPYTIDDRGKPIGADILAVVDGWSESPCRIAHVAPFKNYQSNARLIAAAPDLLYALQLMVSRECGCFNSKNPDWHSDKCFKDIALKAIAKAEG